MKRTVSGIMFLMLIVSMLTLAFNVELVLSQTENVVCIKAGESITPSTTREDHFKIAASPTYPVHNINTRLDYATIQEAIDANETVDGNTIKVDAGTYYEAATINKSVTLVGDGGYATIIDGNGTGVLTGFESARAIFVLKANGIRVMNLTVRNAGLDYGLGNYDACIDCKGQHDIEVENNILQSAGRGMVFGNGVSSITINNNTILDTVLHAIDIGGWTSPTATNVTISNNVIRDAGGSGVNLDGETSNCKIINNTVTDSSNGIELGPNVNTHLVPSGNLIEGNVLSNNFEVNMLIGGWGYPLQANYTNTFRRNNLTNSQHYNLIVVGYNSATFMQDIDRSNTANNKRIYYLTNVSNAEVDPMNSPDIGFLALVNCTNVTVKDFNLASNNDGVLMAYCANCTLTNVTLGDDRVYMTYLWLNESYLPNYGGLTLYDSAGNRMVDSTIYNNTCGICLCHSNGNIFYDNAFINDDRPVVSDRDDPFENVSTGLFSTNFWDNGVEGNYWSNYNGTDANHDGIGDTPYVIDEKNTDHHPLMGAFNMYPVPVYGHPANSYDVTVISNSTITGFLTPISLDTPYPEVIDVSFNVRGKEGSTGFCRVSIPTAVMNGTLEVFVSGTEIPFALLPCSNATVSYLYFNYKQSTEQVIILAEFPSFLILPLLMIPTLVGAIILKKKRNKDSTRFYRSIRTTVRYASLLQRPKTRARILRLEPLTVNDIVLGKVECHWIWTWSNQP